MAIYHLEAKMVSRGAGRSAVAASAYLSCSRMLNDYDGVQHDYTRKQGLAWQAVFLPPMAPPEWQDREKLWNAVEEAEKTKDSRLAVDARVSERALREIYLRGFEIAVKAAAPAAVMSAYNCINGVHAANSRDLCTVVLRQEWGFAGLVMSDWNTTVPQDGSTLWRCAWAGNDIIMPGNPHDEQDIRAALADGRLPETAARQSAARLIALASALRGGVSTGRP